MNLVQCLSHSIEAYDQLRLYASLGITAFDVGGYIDPRNPHDDKRPAVPEMPYLAELKKAVDDLGTPDNLRAAQERLPDALLDWADVIVFHHYLDRLWGQWPRIERWLAGGSHRRVIWRTVGQSVAGNEATAAPFRNRGLQIIRYSPNERNIPNYAGEDALIRFYKDPDEWYGWTGDWLMEETPRGPVVRGERGVPFIGNVTQELAQRHPYTNYGFWQAATEGLPAVPAGPGSEHLRGLGPLGYDQMREYLRGIRVYLYTGTQPASYTLGLIEAMMTGVPVVSIPPQFMRIFPYGPAMFEGLEIAGNGASSAIPLTDEQCIETTRVMLRDRLRHGSDGRETFSRKRAIELFGKETIAAQWAQFLDVPIRERVAA